MQLVALVSQLGLLYRLDCRCDHLATGYLQRNQRGPVHRLVCRYWIESGELDTSCLRSFRICAYSGSHHLWVSYSPSSVLTYKKWTDPWIATFLAIILAVGALLTPSSAGSQIVLTLLFPPMFYTFFTKALASYENIPLTLDILRRSPNGDAPVLALLIVAIVSNNLA